MYEFETAAKKTQFLKGLENALKGEALQHIRGSLTLANGTVIALGDSNIIGQPSIDTQITTDPDTFNIAELYIGTLDILLKTELGEHDLFGGEITIESGVDVEEGGDEDGIEWIPMGVWDCAEAVSQGQGSIRVTGYDHIARLNKALPQGGTFFTRVSNGLNKVAEVADIEYAQTFEELDDLVPYSLSVPFSSSYSPTCWEEIQSIAQILGCFVYADRHGKIAFKRYYTSPVLTITADQRHNIDMSRYSYGVEAFEYKDSYGNDIRAEANGRQTSSVILLNENNRFLQNRDREDITRDTIIESLADEFKLLYWWAGSVTCFNNPALDVGDIVLISGGINGEGYKYFLICANNWQFRSAQTLISGGAPKNGGAVGAGGSGSVYSSTTVYAAKPLITVRFIGYEGQLFNASRTVARACISCRESVDAFITCTMQLLGNASSDTAKAEISVGENVLEIAPEVSLSTNEKKVLSFTLPLTIQGGIHDVTITAIGFGELSAISAAVFGQNITAEELTYSEDYIYEIEEGEATVTGYSGDEVNIEIPEKLGGAPVKTIGDTAFTNNSDIETVYIPDGVEAIL